MRPLGELLKSHFGNDFPVAEGNATRADPLVITSVSDYVAIEHQIAQMLLRGREFKLEEQLLKDMNGRVVDELVFATKPKNAVDWDETRRFFFDITFGFSKNNAPTQETAHKENKESDESPGHTERFLKFLIQWHINSKTNRNTYEEILGKQAPSKIESISDPVDLYKVIYSNFGIRITDKEESELRHYAPLLIREAASSVKRVSAQIAQTSGEKPKMKRYTIWLHPSDTEFNYLKSVEHKWELGGFLLGPIWVVIQKGPPLLALLILALIIAPFLIFGGNFFTVFWALIMWTINARSHAGLQAMRLKSIGYERVGEVSAKSHEDAQAQIKR